MSYYQMPRRQKTTEDLRRHAIKRALQRYDLFLNQNSYEVLCKRLRQALAHKSCYIHFNYGRFQKVWSEIDPNISYLGTESLNRSHWMIDGTIVVYDQKRLGIVTFLPPEAIDNYLPMGTFERNQMNLEHLY